MSTSHHILKSFYLLLLFFYISTAHKSLTHNIIVVCDGETKYMNSIIRKVATDKYNEYVRDLHRWTPEKNKTYGFYFASKYMDFLDYENKLGNYRAVVFTHHPLDTFIRANKRNRKSNDPWILKKRGFLYGSSYSTYIKKLSNRDGILLELTCALDVHELVKLVSMTSDNQNVLLYRDIDMASNLTLSGIIVSDHLGIDRKSWTDASRRVIREKTSTKEEFLFESSLDCIHYNHFNAIYGLSALCQSGYGDTVDLFRSQMQKTCANEQESDKYVAHNCTCYHDSGIKYTFQGCKYIKPHPKFFIRGM